MDKRFEAARVYGQFFILPTIGLIYHSNTTFAPRLSFAWLFWGCSFGLGKKGRKWWYDD